MGTFVHLPAALEKAAADRPPQLAIVLGSGLSVHRLQVECSVAFADIPGLAAPSVQYHRGVVSLGDWAGRRVLVFEGRLHYYEGHPWERVELLPAIAHALGARRILLTNAAGGIHPELLAGRMMAIRDHIEWNRPYCWRAPGPEAMAPPYSKHLLDHLCEGAARLGVQLHRGIYASVTGPSYETPAEIRALKIWGADAVGMSTTREALKAQALGMECAALSCITNQAAGLCEGPITHKEVAVAAAAAGERFANLIDAFIETVVE